MAFITTTFKLDLTPGASRQVLYASQGDIGRPFKAELYWNGSHFDADAYDAILRGKKVDATVFEYDTPVVDGYYVTFSTAEQMTVIGGPVECELVFVDGSDEVASANFVLIVEGSPYDPDALSESDVLTLADAVAGMMDDAIDAKLNTYEAGTDNLTDGAVTTAKLADNSVTSAKIVDGEVKTADLANSAVTNAKINGGAVSFDKLASAVQTRITTAETDIATLKSDVSELEDGKADKDGSYDTLTAGGAKQLLSTVYVDDNEPYNFRTAGGSADIGDRMYEEVVGGSIVWNQLIDGVTNTTTNSGITFTKTDDHTITASGTATARVSLRMNRLHLIAVEPNHVYCVRGMEQNSQNIALIFNGFSESGSYVTTYTNTDKGNGFVLKNTRENVKKVNIECTIPNGTELSKSYIIQPQLIDLTQMFGSTIADYIYTLEQGTAGAGVAWFRKLFSKPYYEYNAGELMSVKAGSHDTVGFTAWDEEWENGAYSNTGDLISNNAIRSKNPIKVIPDMVYHFKCDGYVNNILWYLWYDANMNLIGSQSSTNNGSVRSPSNAYYLNFNTANVIGTALRYTGGICIHLAWDGERNGEYEPYEKHEYPLGDVELRGIPKLDANNQLYYDGDTYASDGTVTRKYGIVDLGTVNWNADEGTAVSGKKRFYAQLGGKGIVLATSDTTNGARTVCSGLTLLEQGGTYNCTNDGYTIAVNGAIYAYLEAFADKTADQFKSAMSGVYLVYELATPTTETADTFVNPQVVDDFGTEEYTDYAVEAGDRDVAIPVGHNSQYMNNLRAKLEMAPDSPDGDGDYIVRQSNGQNSYVPYTADGRLDAIEAKLPAPPSANGTYKLTATVTANGVTYTWVAG